MSRPDILRAAARARLLADAGWGGARMEPLAGDASFRSYLRLRRPDGASAVLMDAPPPAEDTRPFLAVARLLAGLGLSAPAILAADPQAGFVLLEDLGDATYGALLGAAPPQAAEVDLYAAAVDVLVRLRGAALPASVPMVPDEPWRLPPFGPAFAANAELLLDWYLPAVGMSVDEAVRAEFAAAWAAIAPAALAGPAVLMMRDYHAGNLIWLPGRAGLARVGLLDFQDATLGPAAYDLVSLLQDARRDVAPALEAAMIARYVAACTGEAGFDEQGFRTAYAALGAQRNTRILGVFVRLARRDGKPAYLALLGRVWGLLERDLAHPALAPVAAWFDRHLPADRRAGLSVTP